MSARDFPAAGSSDLASAGHTPGPWTWYGNTMNSCPRYFLATEGRGRVTVMDFVRQGAQGVRPRFQVNRRMVNAEELVRFDVDPTVKGVTAAKATNTVYRQDFSEIDHPDARLIAAAPELLEALRTLDTYLDFSEPVEGQGVISFEDPSGFNEAMQAAREALAKAVSQ